MSRFATSSTVTPVSLVIGAQIEDALVRDQTGPARCRAPGSAVPSRRAM